jgi:hypothetical protein
VPAPPIPDDIRRFVLTSIPSVPFVEAILLFRGSSDAIDNAFVANRLYISEQAAAHLVAQLRDARIVEAAGTHAGAHRYAPRDAELAALLDRLAAIYATHLIEISQLIHSRTERAARQFADAFRLRKDS